MIDKKALRKIVAECQNAFHPLISEFSLDVRIDMEGPFGWRKKVYYIRLTARVDGSVLASEFLDISWNMTYKETKSYITKSFLLVILKGLQAKYSLHDVTYDPVSKSILIYPTKSPIYYAVSFYEDEDEWKIGFAVVYPKPMSVNEFAGICKSFLNLHEV